jgi:hypothetical protein
LCGGEHAGAPLKAVLADAVGGNHTLSPVELLVALHALDPARDAVPLKRVMEAVALCFQQRAVYTPEVLGAVLNQLAEQSPLPLLLMRTVIQTAVAAPKLKPRILETLSKLVSKQVRAGSFRSVARSPRAAHSAGDSKLQREREREHYRRRVESSERG